MPWVVTAAKIIGPPWSGNALLFGGSELLRRPPRALESWAGRCGFRRCGNARAWERGRLPESGKKGVLSGKMPWKGLSSRYTSHGQYAAFLTGLGEGGEKGGQDAKKTGTKSIAAGIHRDLLPLIFGLPKTAIPRFALQPDICRCRAGSPWPQRKVSPWLGY